MRKALLFIGLVLMLPITMGVGLGPGLFNDSGDGASGLAGQEPWVFVSLPDFLNVDVGDLSGRQSCPATPYPCYDGSSNSTSDDFEEIIDYMLDYLFAEQPDIVFVAGDLTMGEWDLDVDTTGTFGPVTNQTEKEAAIDAAANFYYPIWKARFTARGLAADKLFPVVGDHDIGDDTWGPGRKELVPTWKAAFSTHLTAQFTDTPASGSGAGTAYATQHKNMKIVSLDLFRQDNPASDDPSYTTDATQDTWLSGVLDDAANDESVDWIIAQGHLPFAGADKIRYRQSSQLVTASGTSETAWTTMTGAEEKLAIYLCGEHHAPTALIDSGLMQLCHGILTGYNMQGTYLVGTVFPDKIELELKMFYQYSRTGLGYMWQTSPGGITRPAATILNPRDATSAQGVIGTEKPFTIGRATIRKAGRKTQYTDLWGLFAGPYFMNYSGDGSLTTYQITGAGSKLLQFPSGGGFPGAGAIWDWSTRGTAGDSGVVTQIDNANVPMTADGSANWLYTIGNATNTIYQRVGNASGGGARHRVFFAFGDRADTTSPTSVAVTLHTGGVPGVGTLRDTVTVSNANCVAASGNQCECADYPPDNGHVICSVTLNEGAAPAGATMYIDFDPQDCGASCYALYDSVWIDSLRTIDPVIAAEGKSCDSACTERIPHGDVASEYYRCSHDDTISMAIGGGAGDELTASYCSSVSGIRICGCY